MTPADPTHYSLSPWPDAPGLAAALAGIDCRSDPDADAVAAPMRHLHCLLLDLIEDRGFTTQAAADAAGLSTVTVARWRRLMAL